MSGSKLNFRNLLIEALLIVFAVLLAMTMSEWRSSLKDEQTKESVLQNIFREIESNKADLESKMDYHNNMSIKFGKYLSSDSLWNTLHYSSGMEAVIQIMEKGIQNPNLQSGAWRSAELSGVVNSFDYTTIYYLSNVYRIQESGPENTWKQLAKLFSDPESYDPENARRLALMLQLGFKELYSQERSLVISYSNTLEALEAEL